MGHRFDHKLSIKPNSEEEQKKSLFPDKQSSFRIGNTSEKHRSADSYIWDQRELYFIVHHSVLQRVTNLPKQNRTKYHRIAS